jgi:hypothetical protein
VSTMVQDHKALWLSPTVFTWAPFVDASTEFKQEPWKRSHALFLHSEQILNNATTDDERADAIVALRRAINSRVRLLDQRYSFRRFPIKDKPSDVLGLLAFVGVVRPRMLRKLIDIRAMRLNRRRTSARRRGVQRIVRIYMVFLEINRFNYSESYRHDHLHRRGKWLLG